MTYEDFATEGTKSRRREYRRSIRNMLGTSSDGAPNVYQALRAAEALDHILRYASGGNMALLVSVPPDAAGEQVLNPVKARLYVEALKAEREKPESLIEQSKHGARHGDGSMNMLGHDPRKGEGRDTLT